MPRTSHAIASLAAFLVLASTAFGATTPPESQTVNTAQINIHNCLLQQNKNEITVDCDFVNNGKYQPDIKYALELLSQDGTTTSILDEKVYDDSFSISENQTLHKTITYTIPEYVNGTATILLLASNSEGLPLSQVQIGRTTHTATGGVTLNDCYLTIAGPSDGTKYVLSYGVDISQKETLIANCKITNRGGVDFTVTPSITTYRRNVFGTRVTVPPVATNSIVVRAGQTTPISFSLPHPIVPQAYDSAIVLTSKDTVVSNMVAAHYVIQGNSATIQSLTLDKDAYSAGDTANLTVFWTGSADSFVGSRAGTSSNVVANAQIDITSGGTSCGKITQKVDTGKPVTVFSVPIHVTCSKPVSSVKLLDSHEQILAEKILSKESEWIKIPFHLDQIPLLYILYGLGGIFVVGGIAFVLYRLRQKRRAASLNKIDGVLYALFLPLIVGGMFFFGTSPVHADTFTEFIDYGWVTDCPDYGYGPVCTTWQDVITTTFSVNLNKSTYSPGETIIVDANETDNVCTNGSSSTGYLRAINQADATYADFTWLSTNSQSTGGGNTRTFVAPSTPGTYTFHFIGSAVHTWGTPGAVHDITYTVVASVPTATLTASPGSVALGNSSTLTATCTNASSASIDNGVGAVSTNGGDKIRDSRFEHHVHADVYWFWR